MTKSYFLVPNFDNPPDGPIRLGNIIASPSAPEDSINQTPPPPISKLYSTPKTNWHATASKDHSIGAGIFTEFLHAITGLGADLDLHRRRAQALSCSAPLMTTQYFRPDNSYLEQSVAEESVRDYFVENRCREPAYMITGVMITSPGTTVGTTHERGVAGKGRLTMDLTVPTGVPLAMGPKFEVDWNTKGGTGFEAVGEFVFAYRLSRIKVERKTGKVGAKDHVKSALFGVGGGAKQAREDVFEVLGAEDGDVRGEDVGMKSVMVKDGEEECECVVFGGDDVL